MRPRRQATRKIKGSRKRLPPSALPASVSNYKPPKVPSKAFKIRSPEWIALKTARQDCEGQLETWFGKD
jgi:hypothetical protein